MIKHTINGVLAFLSKSTIMILYSYSYDFKSKKFIRFIFHLKATTMSLIQLLWSYRYYRSDWTIIYPGYFFYGRLPSYMLSSMITSEVMLKLMLTEDAWGWYDPIGLHLILPNGTTQSNREFWDEAKGTVARDSSWRVRGNAEIIGYVGFKFNGNTDLL